MPASKNNTDEDPPEGYGWTCSAIFCFAGSQPYVRDPHYKDLVVKNQMIEQELEREKLANKKIMKILLLGMFCFEKNTVVSTRKLLASFYLISSFFSFKRFLFVKQNF